MKQYKPSETAKENKQNTSDCIEEFIGSQPIKLPLSIEIFTNEEAKPKVQHNWFYVTLPYEDDFQANACDFSKLKDSGQADFCRCSECLAFGSKLYEYFSIFKALSLIKIHSPQTDVGLWVSSDEFISDNSEGEFKYYGEMYQCPFLQTLGESLYALLSKLKVEIFHYGYANKDIIPCFF